MFCVDIFSQICYILLYSTSRRDTHSSLLVDVVIGMNWAVQLVDRFKIVQIVVILIPLVFRLSIPRKELHASGQQVVTTLALR